MSQRDGFQAALSSLSPERLVSVVSLLDAIAQSAAVDIETLRSTVEHKLAEALQAEHVDVLLTSSTHIEARDGSLHPLTEQSICTYAISSGELVNLPDVKFDQRYNAELDGCGIEKARQIMAVSLRTRARDVYGVLKVVNKAVRRPEPVGSPTGMLTSSPRRSPSPQRSPLGTRASKQGVKLPAINIGGRAFGASPGGTQSPTGSPSGGMSHSASFSSPNRSGQYSLRNDAFNTQDQIVMGVVARALGGALCLCHRSDTTQRTTTALTKTEQLLMSIQSVSTELNTDVVIDRIVKVGTELLEADYVDLFHVDLEARELWQPGEGGDRVILPIELGAMGKVAQTGKSVVLIEGERGVDDAAAGVTLAHVSSILIAPVTWCGDVVGVVRAAKSTGLFEEEELRLATTFASFCGTALHNANMYEAAVASKKQTELLLHISSIVGNNLDIKRTLAGIMRGTRTLLNADRCSVFLVDAENRSLYTTVADGVEQIRLPLSVGLAGHVATTGETLNIPVAYDDPRFNVEIDRRTGYKTRSLLVMPIKHNSSIIGVAELINRKDGEPFSEEDEKLFGAFSAFCGVSVANSLLYDQAKMQASRARSMLDAAMLVMDANDVSVYLSKVMDQVCDVTQAERLSLYTINEKNGMLTTTIVSGCEEDFEVIIPIGTGVAGYVAKHNKIANVADAYNDPRFDPESDERTGFTTRSLLAAPVHDINNRILGVLQLVNKRHGTFNAADKDAIVSFATLCGVALNKNSLPRAGVASARDGYASKFALTPEEKALVFTWQLKPWTYEYNKLIAMLMVMFDHFGFQETFGFPRPKLYRLLKHVSKRYVRTVPYHNFVHAFDVCHGVFMMITTAGLRGRYLTDLNVLTILLSALLHDIDHQGYTNAHMVNTGSPFAMAYSGSIMESHHVSVALSTLSRQDSNILAYLTKPQAKEVWSALIPTILATDLSNRDDDEAFKSMVRDKSFNFESKDHRQMFMRQLIKLADVSNVMRPSYIAYYWADTLTKEFWAQGDVERAAGLEVVAIHDRYAMKLPQMQIGFIQFVVEPSVELMVELVPQLHPILDQLLDNVVWWTKMKEDEEAGVSRDIAAEAEAQAAVDIPVAVEAGAKFAGIELPPSPSSNGSSLSIRISPSSGLIPRKLNGEQSPQLVRAPSLTSMTTSPSVVASKVAELTPPVTHSHHPLSVVMSANSRAPVPPPAPMPAEEGK